MNVIEQRYLRAIRSRVCHHCEDLLPDGMCGLVDRVCPIERNLEQIVLMVHHGRGQSAHPFVDEFRRVICAICPNENSAGRCRLRDEDACALNRYFVLVVETIDDVQEEIRAEAHDMVES